MTEKTAAKVPGNNKMMNAFMGGLSDMETAEPFAKIMIYGESGVGKTVAAMQVAHAIRPPGKSILYVDAVEGWVSLLNHPELKSNTKRLVYQGISQLDFLASQIGAGGNEFFDNIGVLVFDEMSTMTKLDLDIVLKARARDDPSKDADVPTQPDYLANTERSRKIIMKLLKLEIHQIYLSHVREDKDEKQRVMTRPAFMPKFSQTLREGLHVVAYMTGQEKTQNDKTVYVRALQTHPTRSVIAKSRVGGLSVHSTVSKFISVLNEWLKGNIETQEVQDVIEDQSEETVQSDEDPASGEDPAIVV